MEAHVEWREEYNIGVDTVDREHQRLFRIINRLLALQEEGGDSRWACQEGVKFFKSHAIQHFKDEEAYMESIGYEGLEEHRQIHQGFRENTLPALEQELEQTGYAPEAVKHFLGVCAGWLIGHTMTEDQAITGKRVRRWGDLLPDEEIDALKTVIIQLVFDLFHLESRMISDAYSGEKFGDGVYYRLVYGTGKDEKKLEVIMALEEKLLINTVGKIMGFTSDRLDNMLVHTSRYTARQFVTRVLEYFPSMDGYKLKEENLLNYEQVQTVFEREKFQASLLFTTGGTGYFAYCVIAPHLLEGGLGTPIAHDNATDEVEKYLADRAAQAQQDRIAHKPKVLVVDDSLTARHAAKQLLEADYDVSMAESGVAAIRAITLNPPDLVLLDYEMPVCDGRQVLAMLRADPDFSTVPVIFLTSHRDARTMIEVMPLNPSGYLLKDSKPAEIKKEIDAFFARRKS